MKVNYDPHDTNEDTIHPCDRCHKFTKRSWFKQYQKRLSDGIEEAYFCEECI